MFGWLKKLFGKSPAPPDDDDGDVMYPPRERLVYKYHNGQKIISADPMRLYKAVMNVSGDLSAAIKVSLSASKEAPKCHDEWVATARQIFAIAPYEEGGLTQEESVALLDDFLGWCRQLKKNSSPPTTGPGDNSPPMPPSPTGGPPTPTPSPTGSSASASPINGPSPTPSGPPSPPAGYAPATPSTSP